ncbi:MAG: nucleoside monophosphate kinase [Firmicutes bacterium]|nr:nucleoside monophosphate kinase [Bacillota bacterium]
MYIVLLGAPGSGKGTQAEKIRDFYKIPHISTGDIFRQEIKKDPQGAKQIADLINIGHLAPDEIVIKLVKDRLLQDDCKSGALLDGFPRTISQAESMDEYSLVFKQKVVVINLSVPRELLIRRVLGRRVCVDCSKNYSFDSYASLDELAQKLCDCGGKLYNREDDNADIFKTRLEVYDEWTAHLIEYYSNSGNLIIIDGSEDTEIVFENIKAELAKLKKND